MDGDNSLNTPNWGYYEPSPPIRGNNLGLQLMPTMPEKPLLDTRNATFMAPTGAAGPFLYHREVGAPMPPPMFSSMEYMRDALTRRVFSGNPNYSFLPQPSSMPASHMQMVQQPPHLINTERAVVKSEEAAVTDEIENGNGPSKKRQGPKGPKSPKPKKAKKGPQVPKPEKSPSVPRARSVKKTTEVMVNGIVMDISSIPIPVCSCTGSPQQCYRWGSGGWQSACCTTGVSMYPLPMSTKRRGARIAGRKMSIGAFKKVLEKHASEGYNFANPIDLKTHWAKHGTNKFVTIR